VFFSQIEKQFVEFEARAAEAERRIADLEKNGVKQGKKEEEKEKVSDLPSDVEKAEYRIKFLLRALEARDEALKKAEDEVAKRDYQILHLKRCLDKSGLYDNTRS
jgi:predicted  nucleic acid-binding Zn-ribbon protein